MSLEELRKSLVQEAKAEAKRITSAAEKDAWQKLAEARAEAARIVSQAREKAGREAAAEKNERASAAQLRARKTLSEAQNRVLGQGLQKIWKEFSALPERKAEYEKLLKRLISHAEREIGKGAVVAVNARDQGLARKFSKNTSKQAAQISGGAVVSSADGTISVDSSLESVFGQNEDELRKLVYTEIFGGKKK